jgi:uncharacterized NAD-dependent epimerase/dehydratase family protein
VRLVGASLNTSRLEEPARERLLDETAAELGVPCFDPLQTSAAAIVRELEATNRATGKMHVL